MVRIVIACLLLVLAGFRGAEAQSDDRSPTDGELPDSTATDTVPAAPSPVEADGTDEVDRDVPYVPTRMEVVEEMLELADVSEEDVVFDLGSGDGRIVIRAAEVYGARGVGVELDPELVERARENAREAGVADRVEFRRSDLFEADLSGASVVMLYLLRSVNRKLRPKLLRELEPGTRVVSHDFDMGEWEPTDVEDLEADRLYLWRIPEEIPSHLSDDD